VRERLDIKIMSTTPYNKNATAKQERKHLLVVQILKRLHGGHPNTWYQHLPLAEHHLRNTTLVHAGYTPWEMVFGRSPKVPLAANLNQDAMKEHPRARAYLDSLQTSLSAIWQELDASGVIAYQQSFAKIQDEQGKKAGHVCARGLCHALPAVHEDGQRPRKTTLAMVRPMGNRTAPATQRL
jgi:hypothetical protein